MADFEVPTAKKLRLDVQNDGAMASVASEFDDIDDFYDSPPAAPDGVKSITESASDASAGSHQLPFPQVSFTLPGLIAVPENFEQVHYVAVTMAPCPAQAEDTSVDKVTPISTSITAELIAEYAADGVHSAGAGILNGDTSSAEVSILNEHIDQQTSSSPSNNYDEVSSGMNGKLQETDLPGLLGLSKDCISDNLIAVSAVDSADTTINDQVHALAPPEIPVPSVMAKSQSEQTDPQKAAAILSPPDTKTELSPTSNMELDILVEGKLEGVRLPSEEFGQQQFLTVSSEPVTNPDVSNGHIPGLQQIPSEIRGGEAEYELDSLPFESSSNDSSDSSLDSSSDNDYEMLDPAEQARRLMQEDGGSDDDGGKRGTANGPLRTLNERPDEVVEKPDVTITEDMSTEELGDVENVVDNLVLIKARTTGEYQVLETGSVLCLMDRTVIGVVAETLGRVQQPLYTVRFTNTAAISDAGISKGTRIHYVPQHSTYVFTQALQAVKGSDASNIHDEEVGDDELEFSDDEAEAEFRRTQKLQRQARRGGRGGLTNGFSRGPRQNVSHRSAINDNIDRSNNDIASISYDDDAGPSEELYTPLRRPTNLHEQMPNGAISSGPRHANDSRGGRGGRNRVGPHRGHGDRGRGDRGRGRDRIDRNGGTNGHSSHHAPAAAPDLSLPPTPPIPRLSYPMAAPQHPLPSPPFPSLQQGPSYASQRTPTHSSYGYQPSPPGQHQYPSHQGHQTAYHTPQLPALPNFQTPYQDYRQQGYYSPQQYPPASSQPTGQSPAPHTVPPIPPGSFVNPAFFRANYQSSPQQQDFQAQYGGYPPQQNGYTNGRQ